MAEQKPFANDTNRNGV